MTSTIRPRYIRGTQVPITTVFHDSSGGIAQPTSANVVISYAARDDGTVGFGELSDSDHWPLDGSSRLSTTLPLASVSTVLGTWATTWDSAIADLGIVQWAAVPSAGIAEITEGTFFLTGGFANHWAIPSTR